MYHLVGKGRILELQMHGAGEISQGLNMHSILDEYLSLVCRIHDRCPMTACNFNSWASNTFWSLQAYTLTYTYLHIDTFSHIIKYNKNKSFKIKLQKEQVLRKHLRLFYLMSQYCDVYPAYVPWKLGLTCRRFQLVKV